MRERVGDERKKKNADDQKKRDFGKTAIGKLVMQL